MFKLWSERDCEISKILTPTFELRDWNDISREEKTKIWDYINYWFKAGKNERNVKVFIAIHKLNELHKYHSYAKRFLKDFSFESSLLDFEDIFFNQDKHVVLELLSCFCDAMLSEKKKEHSGLYRSDYKTEKEYKEAVTKWKFRDFDKFAERLNDIFDHFGVNLFLTRASFVEKQDSKIVEEIYIPTLNFLSSNEWKIVNQELSDAFHEYQLNTDQGFSNCITHAISSLQAFLQILINGKIGGAEGVNNLIKQAQEKELIPSDKFSSEIFKNIDSILMRERGRTGDAHPKQEYANEKNSRMVLNLVMIFLQHCIQK